MKQAIQVYIGLKRNQVKLTLPVHYTYSKLPRTPLLNTYSMLFWYHCTRLGISQQGAVNNGEKKNWYIAQEHGQAGTCLQHNTFNY